MVVLENGRSRTVAEHERVGQAAVQEPERDARVGRVLERALALDEQQRRALRALLDQPRGGAGDEVRDHVVDRDPPAGDRDARSARWRRRRTRGRARGRRRRARASRTSCRSRSPSRRCARRARPGASPGPAGRSARAARRAGRAARRPRRRPPRPAPASSESTVCRPASTLHPGEHRVQQRRAPLGRQCAAERRDADHQHVRAEVHGLGDAAHDRDLAARVGNDVRGVAAGLRRRRRRRPPRGRA